MLKLGSARHSANIPTKLSNTVRGAVTSWCIMSWSHLWKLYRWLLEEWNQGETRKRVAKACGEYRNPTRKLAVSYESTQTMTIHLPVWYAGAVLLKRDKGAGSHWCWSSDQLPRQKYGSSLVPCSHEANTRIIDVARGAGWHSPKIFSICSHFVLWEAQFQRKYCCLPKIKHLPPKSFWAGYTTDSHHAACGTCC